VLIDGDGEARLCDFGLSQIIAEFQGTSLYSSSTTGQYRWGAIELYRAEEGQSPKLTAACDIYSFGSLMLQVS
jgi:serine/threonine protein kinase